MLRLAGCRSPRLRTSSFPPQPFSLDERKTYTEARYRALGFLGSRLHMLVFTPIHGGVRVISFRKANRREVAEYAHATTQA